MRRQGYLTSTALTCARICFAYPASSQALSESTPIERITIAIASSPLDAMSRLEMMVLSRGLLLPLWAIHKQITSAIDLVVQHDLLADGTRKITRITELAGVDDDRIVLSDLFAYERQGVDHAGREVGKWRCSGARPRFARKCERLGVDLPVEAYAPSVE